MGYVLAVRTIAKEELGFPLDQLRSLGERIEGLDLPESIIQLVHEVSTQTLSPLATCLTLATPPGIKDRLLTQYKTTGKVLPDDLTIKMKEVLDTAKEKPILEKRTKPIPRGTKTVIRSLMKRGLLESFLVVEPPSEKRSSKKHFRLSPDLQVVENFLKSEGKAKPAQAVMVMKLQGSESSSFSVAELKSLGQVSGQTIKSLFGSGILVEASEGDKEPFQPPQLNVEQETAYRTISDSISTQEAERFLLYGVTGSGKTEVYLRAAEEALKQGRQVLYLVPEIALTAQVIAQLRQRFGDQVAIVHSNMTQAERMQSWQSVQSGKSSVVLGARSAIFSPLSNLGLIIIDEEHEASYKQESAPRYQTKRLAQWLSHYHQCPVVAGSATPSIESFYEAEIGKQKLLQLSRRAIGSSRLPDVEIEDLTQAYQQSKVSIFSETLANELEATLERDEQAILFLNRRAFASFLLCRDCGHQFLCPDCGVSLAYHKGQKSLLCHHCGFKIKAPEVCPDCESERVGAFGIGSERVEETVQESFPMANVVRLDRDIARRSGQLEKVLTEFRSGEKNVLVGTQMVAKGLDFPNVTLVGVIAADISLNIPDFRASERTFQLLTQVAGRAGRAEKKGKVIIQTLSPEHISIQTAKNHDYGALYQKLILERKELDYPPFKRLVNILVTGEDSQEVFRLSHEAKDALKKAYPLNKILGPVNCTLEKLRGKYRRHLILKLDHDQSLADILPAINNLDRKKAEFMVDVDPMNMN